MPPSAVLLSTGAREDVIATTPQAAQQSSEVGTVDRKYVSHACEQCRSRRSKCDNQRPMCLNCSKRGSACTYSEVDRRRGKLKKDETDVLVQKLKTLEAMITVFSFGSDDDARDLAETIRARVPSPESVSSLEASDVLDEWNRSRERDVEYNARTVTYTANDLPPEPSIHMGVDAYFNCSYTLFYIYGKKGMIDIINGVYRAQKPVDETTLCELCALTAIGSHYDAQNFDVAIMENLYQTASRYLGDCIESHFLRGMRVVLCLSMYSFMTKRNSARYSLAMGLKIARQARQTERSMPSELYIAFRKVYRSFVFMECWLSSSLGYQTDITEEEVQLTKSPINEINPTIENEIQAHLSAVGLMLADIVRDVYKSSPNVFSIVNKHTDVLRRWQASLPDRMTLPQLKRQDNNIYNEPHRRSLILVHVMFFGAQMLLQRRLLVAMAQDSMDRRWTLDGSYGDGTKIGQQCVAAAEECVILLDVLGYTRHMFRRCWLCIGHAYSACSVLLFDVAQRLLYNNLTNIQDQLARIQECINMLEGCSQADRVARCMLEIVAPLHQKLQRLASEQPGSTRSGIYDLLENPQIVGGAEVPIRADVIPAMLSAIEVLGNPFGHVRRNDIDSFAAGDPSVPSWWN